MSPEIVSQAVKAYFAAIRAMDESAWVNTFAEDAISYDPVGAPPTAGHPRLREFYQTITAAFKEVGLTEDEVFVAGNGAAVRWTGRGISRIAKYALQASTFLRSMKLEKSKRCTLTGTRRRWWRSSRLEINRQSGENLDGISRFGSSNPIPLNHMNRRRS